MGRTGDVSTPVLTDGPRKIPRERLALTERLYLAGKPRARITDTICRKFGVTARTARRYIEITQRRLAALPKPPPEAVFHRAEAMLLEAYQLARNGVQRISVSRGAGAGSVVEECPQANVGAMVAVATRLAELYGLGGDTRPKDTTAAAMRLPRFLTEPRVDPAEIPGGEQ